MKFERWKEPFDRAGMWIVRRFPALLCGKQGKKTEEKLKLLATTRGQISLEEFYTKKFSEMCMLLFGGGMVLGLLALGFSGGVEWMEHPAIRRPGYGEGSLETELTVKIRDEELDVPVTVSERKYSQEELDEVFHGILGSLDEDILGENLSLEEVKTDLELPESFLGGVISARWEIDPSDYMDQTGHFLCEVPKEGVLATLQVTLSYGQEERMEMLPVQFLPRDKTLREETIESLQAQVKAAGQEAPEAEEIPLPESVKGEPIRWGNRVTSPFAVGFLLLGAGLFYLYGKDERKLMEEEKRRRQQLIMDYPVILYKMSMLLGAGMTIRGAFSKIAFHYRDGRSKEVRYAYEEMLLACYEMEKGIGEAAAYENFGQKCRDLRYLKFGSLLSQTLKKGSEGLADVLEQEARSGMEERKNLARKLGEEAGTRLLLPMMLMMVLVMAILMVPAMLSF